MKKRIFWEKIISLGLAVSLCLNLGRPSLALTSPTPEPPSNTITTEEHFSVPSGVIFAWPSTEASIPSGWSRVAGLDSKYLQGTAAGVNPGATGGSATHTHTSPSLNHTQVAHTHNPSLTLSGFSTSARATGTLYVASKTHTHGASVSSVTATNNATTATVVEASSDPPYYDVIWIQSDGTTDIPNSAVALFNSVTPPSGWGKADGGDSRPNMLGQFLRGAATGLDGGGTGGATTHTHTSSHTHTQNSHTHTVGSLEASSGTVGANPGDGSSGVATNGHTHTGSGTSPSTAATNNAADGNIASANGEPPYRYLVPTQNTSGAGSTPGGVIGVWTGTLASIPSGWALCDGTGGTPDLRAYFVKSINVDGDLGLTGGTQGHGHSATAHNHTQASHSHGETYTSGVGVGTVGIGQLSGTAVIVLPGHTHTVSLASTIATNNSATLTVDTNSDTRPPFYAVAFIQATNQAPTAPTTLYTNEGATTAQSGDSNPVAVGDGTPVFSAVYNDPDTGDIANKYEVIAYSNAACSSQVWDSGSAGTSMTNCTQGNRCGDITFAGTALIFDGKIYYWKIKYWDDDGAEGAFSDCTANFTILGPYDQMRHGNYFFNRKIERVFTW